MASIRGTKYPDVFKALTAPFPAEDVLSRKLGPKTISYVTAATVMSRLDEVLGPENWSATYEHLPDCMQCTMTIRMPDGVEITKSDLGGAAGMPDRGDDKKSMLSDALKRAAAAHGVARYLRGDYADFEVSNEPIYQPANPKPDRSASSVRSAQPVSPVKPSTFTDRFPTPEEIDQACDYIKQHGADAPYRWAMKHIIGPASDIKVGYISPTIPGRLTGLLTEKTTMDEGIKQTDEWLGYILANFPDWFNSRH